MTRFNVTLPLIIAAVFLLAFAASSMASNCTAAQKCSDCLDLDGCVWNATESICYTKAECKGCDTTCSGCSARTSCSKCASFTCAWNSKTKQCFKTEDCKDNDHCKTPICSLSKRELWFIVVPSVVGGVVIILCIWIYCCCCRKSKSKLKYYEQKEDKKYMSRRMDRERRQQERAEERDVERHRIRQKYGLLQEEDETPSWETM